MPKRGPIIRRVDASQHAIVKALRAVGASAEHCHIIGHGFPDILVGFERNGKKVCIPVEIKEPNGKLTPDELDWQTKWKGPIATVHSVEEALALLES